MGPGHQKSRRWVVDVSLCASCPVGMSVRYNRGRRAGGRGQNLYPLFRFQKIEEGPSCWSSVLLFDLPKRSGKYMHFYSVCAICAHQYGLVCCLSVLKGGSSVFLCFSAGVMCVHFVHAYIRTWSRALPCWVVGWTQWANAGELGCALAAVTFATVDPFQTQDLAILDGQLRSLCVVQGGHFLLFLQTKHFVGVRVGRCARHKGRAGICLGFLTLTVLTPFQFNTSNRICAVWFCIPGDMCFTRTA